MRHDLIVSEKTVINTTAERIWEVLTNPELIKKYLFGTETITDWKIGSKIIFQGEYDGKRYSDHGYILENIPFQKLKYSYWTAFSGLEDIPENYSQITYFLETIEDKKIEFTWTQQGFATENGRNHSAEGMAGFLNEIKKIAENN